MNFSWDTIPSYYKRYILDKEITEVAIRIEIYYKTLTENFFFKYKYHDNEIIISWVFASNNLVQITIENLKIPKALLEDLKNDKGFHFIISIINQTLPAINNRLDYLKYNKGNILIKRISFLDFSKIQLIYHEKSGSQKEIIIPLPIFPKEFPPLQKKYFKENLPPIYIRDYIDAMESYIKYDFNDCVRKLITSLENCFYFYKLRVKKHHS